MEPHFGLKISDKITIREGHFSVGLIFLNIFAFRQAEILADTRASQVEGLSVSKIL